MAAEQLAPEDLALRGLLRVLESIARRRVAEQARAQS